MVDWYFSYRLDNFLKVFFDGILKSEWRWHRYEWQSRTAIHAHGAARLSNDPGLINLTAKVYIGRQAQKSLVGYVISNIESYNMLINEIMIGEESG